MTDPVGDPLYVLCLGAPTNVANALLIAPEIAANIVVVWDASSSLTDGRVILGGLNLNSDLVATRVLFESGVPLLYVPGFPTAQGVQLSRPEMDAWFKGEGPVSDALWERYATNPDYFTFGTSKWNQPGTTRMMWDTSVIQPFVQGQTFGYRNVSAPRLVQLNATCDSLFDVSCKGTYPGDPAGHLGEYTCEQLSEVRWQGRTAVSISSRPTPTALPISTSPARVPSPGREDLRRRPLLDRRRARAHACADARRGRKGRRGCVGTWRLVGRGVGRWTGR